jgi:hypothetical protein
MIVPNVVPRPPALMTQYNMKQCNMKQSNAMQHDQGLIRRRVHVKGFAFGDLRTEIRPPVLLQDGHGGQRAGERDPARHGATSARPFGGGADVSNFFPKISHAGQEREISRNLP